MNGKSYIISNYKVSKTTHDYVNGKLKGIDAEGRRFFLHLLCSHLLTLQQDGGVLTEWHTHGLSLPSNTIKAEFARGFSWKVLERQGLIAASDYSKGKCRYFYVPEPHLGEILEHIGQSVATPDGSPAVNIFDGTAWSAVNTLKANGVASSKLMRDAVRVLSTSRCPFNVAAIQKHLSDLERAGQLGKLQNDKLCAQHIFAGTTVENGLGKYTPSYRAQTSGRIGEVAGGVQSCSRLMKEAAFTGIENLFNYDLRSSQGYALLHELRLAGIDDTWLVAHLGLGVFDARAADLGLSKGTYKKCFFSTIMGASHQWLKGEHLGAVQDVAIEQSNGQEAARTLFDRIVKQLAPLKELVKQWTAWLLTPECPHLKETQRREVLENAAGQKLVLDRRRLVTDLKREAAAHILQGQEAAYIHHLTLLSKDFGFMPVSNQHDGLITLGEIPKDARKLAADRSGFQGAFLDHKAFV